MNSSKIQQVIDQPDHLPNLTPHDVRCPLDGLRVGVAASEQGEGIAERGQRVAELVPQHGQELVLAAVGLLKVSGLTINLGVQAFHFGILAGRCPVQGDDVALDAAQFAVNVVRHQGRRRASFSTHLQYVLLDPRHSIDIHQ
jgi:hypothetical protein